ncbi:hypothetical protein G3I44_14490 [Halogeometricum borinquense]|uniref:DUF8128 domain-containing protein n=1 Tax=Halogeometricum borinquense TaxID=60847 RepID=A0A6C0UIX6_9EURY|nr:hypothetical protein [Halogeometricum borinquense]QIB75395.1 hypothetical protein G3I44_14490 [Halogeometricum borinquense]
MTGLLDRFKQDRLELDEQRAERLQAPAWQGYVVEVRPPRGHSVSDITSVLRTLRAPRTKWLGLKNTSAYIVFEIIRDSRGLRFQYAVPTKTVERELRSQLHTVIPNASFHEGTSGLPVIPERAVAGGLVSTGRQSWYPLYTDHTQPVMNGVAASLHDDAMQDTSFVIQIVARPVATDAVRSWYRSRRTGMHITYLNKEKEQLWGRRSPTPLERRKAQAVETKMRAPLWQASIRCITVSYPTNEALPARFYESVAGFSRMENDQTGQFLRPKPVQTWREASLYGFAQAVADRQFNGWSRWWYATSPELGALLTPPNIRQDNISAARA